jgi:DNA-binding transcriptional LysR family regulator
MSDLFPVPLNALRAIETVARVRTLGAAAELLGVTPGAVSQHVRRAEERLGLLLFDRSATGLVPTEALEKALPQLRAGFNALAAAGETLSRRQNATLTVTVGNVFASRWLVWRMNKFSVRHPEIDLRLAVTGNVSDLGRGDLDCAVRFGQGSWPDVRARRLGGFSFQPVCAPEMAAALAAPADLGRVPVIRDTTTMLDWDAWWRAAGIDTPPEIAGPVYSDPALAFDAAISGQGVLLAVDMMSADSVSDGRLVRPFDCPAGNGNGYWLVTDAARSLSAKVRAFAEWLDAEIPASACGYVGQLTGGQPRLVTRPVDGAD